MVDELIFRRDSDAALEQLKQRLLSLKPHLADTYAYCERETSSLQKEFTKPSITAPQTATA